MLQKALRRNRYWNPDPLSTDTVISVGSKTAIVRKYTLFEKITCTVRATRKQFYSMYIYDVTINEDGAKAVLTSGHADLTVGQEIVASFSHIEADGGYFLLQLPLSRTPDVSSPDGAAKMFEFVSRQVNGAERL